VVNKWIGIGRLGRDVELKFTQSGQAVANFSIACSETWYDKDQKKQEKTEWVNVVVWNKTAENCGQYIGKGSLVYIEGKLQTRKYDDKNGVTKYITEVVAQQVKFLDKKGERGESGGGEDIGGGAPALDDTEIPF
jgi:single-strand DNA-binding protein